MAVHTNSEESRILRTLVPLATFPSAAFAELCMNITVEQVQDGAIFKKGDTDTHLVYLLNGSVTLQSERLVVEVITSESESAIFALAHQIPRKIDAVANGVARIVRLDAYVVNNPPPAVYREDQSYTIIEESGEDSDDWMTALLRLPLFQSLPPANLQKILISLKTAYYSEGDIIIANGSVVDHFFIITKGQCLLSRNSLEEGGEIRLGAGESFGEEYLITNYPAQETITALSDVSLIQLEKKHFLTQIKGPTLTFISHEDMPDALVNGAVLVDVRPQRDYENHNLDGSANIPLLSLRMRIAEIPRGKQVIVACANGKVSGAAAFLLVKNRFNATVLKGGMGIEESDTETGVTNPDINRQDTSSPDQSNNVIADKDDNSDTTAFGFETQFETLKAENERLAQCNRDLEERNLKLQAEKEQAENDCSVLTQQLEKLKEILNRFTKRQ
ncbi:cyclic nucleotide-binding domain-containing protein [Methyloglobulus sp.]|uniref:cyclic nucleotide-binding domain-containing protein n=1 Tax=Methyloglobulus sp. TaxID=2518622 RepID=UPI00398977A6